MGFAAKWAAMMGEPQPPTPKDKLDRMDTIRGGQPEQGSSVHIVHTVHKGARPAESETKGNSVHCVHIVHRGSAQDAVGKEASAPGSETDPTGLGWLPGPPDEAAPSFDGWWAAFDLADLCKLYAVRVFRSAERILAVYPPSLEAELIAYAGSLLVEAQDYLRQHIDRLPVLTPAQAVTAIKEIMRQHRGLRFCRGDGGSRWPLYPRTWAAGQKATVQTLWFVAGPALDQDAFEEIKNG